MSEKRKVTVPVGSSDMAGPPLNRRARRCRHATISTQPWEEGRYERGALSCTGQEEEHAVSLPLLMSAASSLAEDLQPRDRLLPSWRRRGVGQRPSGAPCHGLDSLGPGGPLGRDAMAHATDLAVIGELTLFKGLERADLARLAELLRWRALAAGASLMLEEQPGEAAYFIAEGTVRVYATPSDGHEVT